MMISIIVPYEKKPLPWGEKGKEGDVSQPL